MDTYCHYCGAVRETIDLARESGEYGEDAICCEAN